MNLLPNFAKLVAAQPSLIGTIVRSLEDELERFGTTENETRAIWSKFDAQFSTRLDYRLWRHWFIAFQHQGIPTRWAMSTHTFRSKPQLPHDLLAELSRTSQEISWGVMAVLCWHCFDKPFSFEGFERILIQLLEKVAGLAILPACPANCITAEIVLSGKIIQYLTEKDRDERNLRELVRRHVFRIAHLLHSLDPDTKVYPGSPVSLRRLFNEDEDLRLRLIPANHRVVVLPEIAAVLGRVPTLCNAYRLVVPIIAEEAGTVAVAAFEAACAAWRIRKMVRKASLIRHGNQTSEDYRDEMNAIRTAAFAAIPARDFVRSGGFWWLYQTMFVHKRPPKFHVEKWTLARLREIGLDVHAYFSTENEHRFRGLPAAQKQSLPPNDNQTTSNEGDFLDEDIFDGEGYTSDVFDAILNHHRLEHPLIWEPLQKTHDGASIPTRRVDRAIRWIAERFDKGKLPADQRAVMSIFEIALHVDFVRTAMDMLRLIDTPSVSTHLIPAAKSIAKCTQINRIALSNMRLNEWLLILKTAWEKCVAEPMRIGDRLFLHEVLVGRHATIKGSLSTSGLNLLLNRRLDALLPPNYIDVTEAEEDAFRLGPAPTKPKRLNEFVTSLAESSLGAPLIVSVVALDSGTSIVSYGKDTVLTETFRLDVSLVEDAKRLIARRKSWFKHKYRALHDQVRWPDNFIRLRDILLETTKKNSGTKWIMLAVEPHLAGLPWQHLFAHSLGLDPRHPLLITIVPNMGWGHLRGSKNSQTLGEPKSMICKSNDPDIISARRQLDIIAGPSDPGYFNYSVVLGHGHWARNAGEHPEILIDGVPITAEQWCDLTDREIMFLHSCWSGTTNEATPWADGALTVHLLGGNCRAVFAPVGYIRVSAMGILHKRIIMDETDAMLGERYLQAVTEEPETCLYNLYGFGSISPFVKFESGKNIDRKSLMPQLTV